MTFRVAAVTDVGRVREQNEDSYVTALPLVAVADGMGGHQAGEVASQLAISVIKSWRDEHQEDGADRLRDAVVEANRAVWDMGKQQQGPRMGTTLTAAWVDEDNARVSIAHVGDSRAYLLRRGKLEQLTEDQTVVQDLVNRGRISPDEAFRHPQRSILQQALGGEPGVDVEMVGFELQPGDRLVLATDGLHGIVTNERIHEILLQETDLDTACRSLVAEANAAGGDDNITVVILEAAGSTQAAPAEAEDDAPPAPVIVSKPESGRSPPARRATRRKIAVALVAAVVALVVAGFMWLSNSATKRYFVAARGDAVAIVQGRTAQDATVVQPTDLTVSSLPPNYQRTVRTGIREERLSDAERTVENLKAQRVLGPSATPVPSETPIPTPPPSP